MYVNLFLLDGMDEVMASKFGVAVDNVLHIHIQRLLSIPGGNSIRISGF